MGQDDLLASYLSITNSTSTEHARAALESTGWDLERAVAIHFDSYAAPTTNGVADSSSFDPLEVDDSDQAGLLGDSSSRSARAYADARGRNTGNGIIRRALGGPLAVVAAPVSVLLDVTLSFLRFLARILRIRLPSLSLRWPGQSRPANRLRTDPRSCAERWLRTLEEETGATSSSTFQEGTSSAASSSKGDLTYRGKAGKRLPGFFVGSYESALREAREQMKVLMVVLVTDEHDDVAHFKRSTLTNEDLLQILDPINFVVWGGDVADRDAFSASQILDATTFPFIAFVALQPKRTGSLGSTAPAIPRMAVCSRLEGPPSNETSPENIVTHISNTLLPRTLPYLDRLRVEQARREEDRRRREEQQRANQEAGRRDLERVMKKKAELDAAKAAEDERLRRLSEEEDRRRQADLTKRKAAAWRAWARREKLPAEPTEGGSRISFRLGDGRRVIRRFANTDPIESVYVFVDCESLPVEEGDFTGYDHTFAFKLSTAMPRRLLEGGVVGDYGLHGAIVNVEGLVTGDADDSDGDE